MEKHVRARVLISGRVQGVYYRMETLRAAERYDITGWVRNKNDGSVEAVFEGEKEKVDSIIAWCKQGPPHALVRNVNVEWEDYLGEFERFEITY